MRGEQAELSAANGQYKAAFEQLKQYMEEVRAQNSAEVDSRAGVLQAVFETEQAQQESQRFRDLSLRDPLTGLFNRRHVDDHLPVLLQLHADSGQPVSVVFVDLDHFKRVNDECSHAVGDEVLKRVAEILTEAVGDNGFVARMGGEEFLLVIPGASTSGALVYCETVQDALRAEDWTPLTGAVRVRASMGLASTSEHVGASQAELLGQADRRVYRPSQPVGTASSGEPRPAGTRHGAAVQVDARCRAFGSSADSRNRRGWWTRLSGRSARPAPAPAGPVDRCGPPRRPPSARAAARRSRPASATAPAPSAVSGGPPRAAGSARSRCR